MADVKVALKRNSAHRRIEGGVVWRINLLTYDGDRYLV